MCKRKGFGVGEGGSQLAREAGFELDLCVGNALVHMYAKCGSMDDTELAFHRMEEWDVIT
jgi:pentatricopeptide repeat protein